MCVCVKKNILPDQSSVVTKHLNETYPEILRPHPGDEWRPARDVTNSLFVYMLTNKSVHTQCRV